MSTDVFQQMKGDKAVQFTAGHQTQMKHPGEPKGHSSSKRRRSMSPRLSNQGGGTLSLGFSHVKRSL